MALQCALMSVRMQLVHFQLVQEAGTEGLACFPFNAFNSSRLLPNRSP